MKKQALGRWLTLVVLVAGLILQMGTAALADYDLGGRTVQFGIMGGGVQQLFDDPRHLAHIEAMKELFNADVELLPLNAHGGMNSAAIQKIIQDILEGDTSMELVMVASDNIPGLVREGLIQPLDDVFQEIEYFENVPAMYRNWNFVEHMGKVWGADRSEVARNVEIILWNRSMFEREGLPNLDELYENGEWTWDAFREIVQRATKDTSGDGEIDQWGFASFQHYAGSPKFMINWAYTNNATPTRTVDGREVFAFNSPEALEALEFWVDLVEQDVVRLGQFNLFSQQRVAMAGTQIWASEAAPWHGIAAMDDDWSIIPFPRGPRSDRHVAPMNFSWLFVIPVHNPNPAESIELFNALFGRSNKYVDVEEFHENMWYNTYAINHRDRQTDTNMRWSVENMEFIPYVSILLDGGFGDAITSIWAGQNPATAMAEIEPTVQQLLDEMIGY